MLSAPMPLLSSSHGCRKIHGSSRFNQRLCNCRHTGAIARLGRESVGYDLGIVLRGSPYSTSRQHGLRRTESTAHPQSKDKQSQGLNQLYAIAVVSFARSHECHHYCLFELQSWGTLVCSLDRSS